MSETSQHTEIHELWSSAVAVGIDDGFDVEMIERFTNAGAKVVDWYWESDGFNLEVTGISREKVLELARHSMEVMPQRRPKALTQN